MASNQIIISDIRDSIEELVNNYREKEEMAIINWKNNLISIGNFERNCYDIMIDVMFYFRVAPEYISFENNYCIFEYEGLFFWIGFNVDDNCETKITIFFEININDFKFSRPHMNISDRCDGWADDGLFSWMGDI